MKSYPVFYNEGSLQGTVESPRTEGEIQENERIISTRLEGNWQQLEVAKVLEGLTILSRQKAMGTCCVSGPLEKVEALRSFLEDKKIGTVIMEDVAFRQVL